MRYISPYIKWTEDNQQDGKLPLVQDNLRTPTPDACPVFQLIFDREDTDISIKVDFKRPVYSKPFFGIDDFDGIMNLVAQSHPDDYVAQATDLNYMVFKDTPVYVVGYVYKVKDCITDREGNIFSEYSIRGCALYAESATKCYDDMKNENILVASSTPAETIAKELGIETAARESVAETESTPVKKTKTTKKVTKQEELVVDAPVVEVTMEKGKKISYADNPTEALPHLVKICTEASIKLGHANNPELITKDFIKSIIAHNVVDSDSIQEKVYTIITKKVFDAVMA